MGGLEDRPGLAPGDRATSAVRVQHHCLECPLTQALRSEAWISVYGSSSVPRLAEIDLGSLAEQLGKEVFEVARRTSSAEIVALALDNVGGELGGRFRDVLCGEETCVPDEDAPDYRILTGVDRLLTVAPDATSHLLQVCR